MRGASTLSPSLRFALCALRFAAFLTFHSYLTSALQSNAGVAVDRRAKRQKTDNRHNKNRAWDSVGVTEYSCSICTPVLGRMFNTYVN